jgi:hypothetical protein
MDLDINKIVNKNDQNYLITNKTEQNKKMYYYAVLLNDKNVPTTESHIFSLEQYDGDNFLVDVKDEKLLGTLGAIFTNQAYKNLINGE